jgi:hypothetical protein
LDVFDLVFLLHIDARTQEARLAAHDAHNPPGRVAWTSVTSQQNFVRDGGRAEQAEDWRAPKLGVSSEQPVQSNPYGLSSLS